MRASSDQPGNLGKGRAAGTPQEHVGHSVDSGVPARPFSMARSVELRRHTDNDGDVLTGEGVRAALEIGARLTANYDLLVSSGAQRSTQTLACFLAAMGRRVRRGVLVEPGLRSRLEDRWRAAYRQAGSAEMSALRTADPELVEQDGARLAAALRRVLDELLDGERALAVGHSPTNEAAVMGLTAIEAPPMGKGQGVLVVVQDADVHVEPLQP